MGQEFQYDVFLSHSAQDKAVVRPLAERLRTDGLQVWFDEWVVKPDDDVAAKIKEGLEQSRVMVLCVSANALSDAHWPELEARTLPFRDPLNKELRFVPLLLDAVELPGHLAKFGRLSLVPPSERDYPKLFEACRPPAKVSAEEVQRRRESFELSVVSLGHTGPVRSVALSPDGRYALSGADDKTVRLWEVESGRCLGVLEGHTASVFSVAWSADGRRALSGADDKTVRLWEVESGRCLRVLEGHTARVYSVAWSADGRRALSGAEDKTVRLWEVESGRCLRVLEGHTARVYSVAWSADGRRALSGAEDKTVRLWEVESGRCLRVLEGHTASVFSVAWSADGRRALSGAEDKTVRLWEVESGRCLRVLEGHTASVLSVAWSADGRRALFGALDNTVRLWEVESGRCLRVLEGHTASVFSVAWSADGRRALSGAADKTVRLWEVESGRCLRVLEGHTASVYSVAWSADGRRALSGAADKTVRLWEVESRRCLGVLEGHTASVFSVAWSADGRRALSGAADKTVRLWEVESGRCLRVLEGHTARVLSVAWSADGRRALSGAADNAVRLWEVESGRCLRVLEGHTDTVWSVAWSADGRRALSGAEDKTVRLWEVESGRCLRVLEGHTDSVLSVAWSADGRRALSGAADNAVRLWEVESGRCLRVLEGHTDSVYSVAWSADGRRALSGAADKTVRLWEVESGRCLRVLEGHTDTVWSVAWSADGRRAFSGAANGVMLIWDAEAHVPAEGKPTTQRTPEAEVFYTNTKVLLVGDTHSGKTGLAHRLATGQWKPTDGSTVGAWSTQWRLDAEEAPAGVEREIWLWDFGGQSDQRLIHQLYMDRTGLILLLFDADQEEVLPGLRDWRTALRRCVAARIPQILVAGRIDAGFKASRGKLQSFAKEEKLDYVETSARTGEGCDKLRGSIMSAIRWEDIPVTTTEHLFKVIKDEVLKLRDEGKVLYTFKDLHAELWRRLPDEPRFTDETLRAVIGLLDGPGAVKELDYGTYILLQPEWVNAYAQAVIRTLRSDEKELGRLPLQCIAQGKLVYQSVGRDGVPADIKRLPQPEERIVLGEMERQLMERGLCLRQGDKLVFPSHCGRDRPKVVEHPSVFVSYAVKGYLDDLYATLVVKLADSEAFNLTDLWRDAADFDTLEGGHRMGIKLVRETASSGEINVYFGPGVTQEQQVIFANYIHAHLASGSEQVQRLRHYVCPKCHTPKGNPQVLMEKLLARKQDADTECDKCGKRFGLWDALEKKFASEKVRQQVEGLQAEDVVRLDSRRKGKLLALEVGARITSADQKCFEIPATEDEGLDMELEFTDEAGKGTGKRLYLQLKAGNSYLRRRQKDGAEIFTIKKQGWVKNWLKQPHPVMLVIGTFAEGTERHSRKDKLEFADVRWMEISSVLRRESQDGKKPVKHIEFKGERLDMTSIYSWRDRL